MRLGRPGARRARMQAALWVCLAPIAVYAPKGTVVLLCLLLVTAPDLRRAVASLPRYRASWVVRCLAAFLLWALVSAAWAPEPLAALGAAARLALLSLLGLVLVAATAEGRGRAAWRGMCVSAATIGVLLGVETVTGGGLGSLVKSGSHGNLTFTGPGSAVLALLAFPAALAAARAFGRAWLLPAGAGAAILVVAPLPVFASLAAAAIGLLVLAAAWRWRGRALVSLLVLVSAQILAIPFIMNEFKPLQSLDEKTVEVPISWQHRLGIWEYVSQQALRRPFIGHGFDSARVLGRDPPTVRLIGPTGSVDGAALPLHPHSLGLQLWLELGLVGVVLALGLLWSIGRATLRIAADRQALAGISGSLAATTVIASVSFGAWQSWWIATLWLCAVALMLAVSRRDAPGA